MGYCPGLYRSAHPRLEFYLDLRLLGKLRLAVQMREVFVCGIVGIRVVVLPHEQPADMEFGWLRGSVQMKA